MDHTDGEANEIGQFFSDVKARNLARVKLALERGMSPNARELAGTSALCIAAESDSLDIATLLISSGANVNQRNHIMGSKVSVALHCAIAGYKYEMVDLLLNMGADPRVTDEKQRNAAHLMIDCAALDDRLDAEEIASSLALFKRLATSVEVINKLDKKGRSVLHAGIFRTIAPDVVDFLLSSGSDCETMNWTGSRPIHRTWKREDIWLLRKLVDHGANINARDGAGASVLSHADDTYAFAEMLGMGADINHVDDLGRNALAILLEEGGHILALGGWMIEAGIDTATQDYTGASADSRLASWPGAAGESLRQMIASRRAREAMQHSIGAGTKRQR